MIELKKKKIKPKDKKKPLKKVTSLNAKKIFFYDDLKKDT
jgi:hypothetical protein